VNDSIPFRPADVPDPAWLKDLVDRANSGELTAVAELRTFLDENEHVWRRLGDMGAHAENFWINLISSKNRLLVESVTREIDRMRQELLGESASPVEKLLVDQIVANHLEVRYREQQLSSGSGVTAKQKSATLKAAESAQRRYLHAVKTLEEIRGLAKKQTSPAPLRLLRTSDAS
jgi:hypothetical protein